MPESLDPQLMLKKRARRRLVGAVAFAGLAAVVLPMVMDEEPRPPVQDVQISIPDQARVPPLNPPLVAPSSQPAPVAPALVQDESASSVLEKPAASVTPAPAKAAAAAAAVTPATSSPSKSAEKQSEKNEKINKPVVEKANDKHGKPAANETQRAAAILDGKPEAAAHNDKVPYVILIGAFSNPANVKQLQNKIGDLGIKTFTEPLDSPQGKKTRVRAGPFPNREAAEKALERIKRIGVSGVVAAKQ